MIETWAFYLFPAQNPWDGASIPAQSYQAQYDAYLDLWCKCEEWGFDGLAFAEHHFHPISLSPSPHLLIASVAARTKRIKLAVMGSVLALHDPRRHAEEVGMLNYLSQGRFEPGIGPGAGVHEAVLSGLDPAKVRPRYYSGANLLAKALAERVITHQDEFSNLKDVQIVPPPHLRPGQSVWVTAVSPESVAWTAQRGYKLATSWVPTSVMAMLGDHYRAAADAAGRHVDPSMLGIRRRVFVADSDAEAQEIYEASKDLVLFSAGQGFETVDENFMKMITHPDDFAIGSPETVAEKLISQCRAGGFGVLLALTDFAQFPVAALARSHELIGTRVRRLLRSAEVGDKHRAVAAA